MACDRIYALDDPDTAEFVVVTAISDGDLPMSPRPQPPAQPLPGDARAGRKLAKERPP